VFGDSAYADGATLQRLTDAGHDVFTKVPPLRKATGSPKPGSSSTQPRARSPAPPRIPSRSAHAATAGRPASGELCAGCPLRSACTKSRNGRVIAIHPHEATLQRAKTAQRHPDRQQTYPQTRPLVERKIAHFARRPWGGRKARCRGAARVLTDILARAAAVNLARLAALGLHGTPNGWATT
jgi:hypothetical protein